jgi:hypothetical protein
MPTGQKWMVAVIVMVPMFLMLIVLVAATFGSDRRMHALGERGTGTLATVTKLTVDPERHEHRVYYTFQPKEFAGRPYSTIHGDDMDVPQEFYRLGIGGTVPIVYDPKDPDRSALRWSVERARGRNPWPVVWIVGAIIILLPCLTGGILCVPYLWARHLLRWGKIAEATITGEAPRPGSGGYVSVVSFQFQDDKGETVNGENAWVPSASTPYPETMALRRKVLGNRTVIFSPRNSRWHVLYPSSFARLADDR